MFDPQVKRLSKVKRFTTESGGVVDVDYTGAFMGAWFDMVESSADAGAEALKRAIVKTFEQEGQVAGHAEWTPNEPATVEWKGIEKPMLGRTGAMLKAAANVEVRSSVSGTRAPRRQEVGQSTSQFGFQHTDTARALGLSPGDIRALRELGQKIPSGLLALGPRKRLGHIITSRFVGVFDQSIHPDSVGRDSPLTVAEMFALHEFGSTDGHVPARPWISRAGDLAADETLKITQTALATAITAYSQYVGTQAAREFFEKTKGLTGRRLREAQRMAHQFLPTRLSPGKPLSATNVNQMRQSQMKLIGQEIRRDPAAKEMFRNLLTQAARGEREFILQPARPSRTGYRPR